MKEQMIINSRVWSRMTAAGVRADQIARSLGIIPEDFREIMRHELTEEQTVQIMDAINQIIEERRNRGCMPPLWLDGGKTFMAAESGRTATIQELAERYDDTTDNIREFLYETNTRGEIIVTHDRGIGLPPTDCIPFLFYKSDSEAGIRWRAIARISHYILHEYWAHAVETPEALVATCEGCKAEEEEYDF